MRFTRLGFDVLDAYTEMVREAASEVEYESARNHGERALAARLELAKMNPTFTTRVVGVLPKGRTAARRGSPARWSSTAPCYALTDGTKGTLVQKLPLEWAFRRDPHDTGVASGWAYKQPVDLTWWKAEPPGPMGRAALPLSATDRHRLNPGHWELLRTDLYMQAQGVVSPDYHSYTGHAWYRTDFDLPAAKGKTHVMFPGLFNECWLYVNGNLVAHRAYKEPWWLYGLQVRVGRGPERAPEGGREHARGAGEQPAPLRRHVPPPVPVRPGGEVTPCRVDRFL